MMSTLRLLVRFRRSLAALLLLAASTPAQPPAPPAEPAGVSIAGEAPEGFAALAVQVMREIEGWRGARFERDVRVEFIDPTEETGKKAGWYEPSTRRLVVVKKGSERFQRGTLLHELVHALQDQRFGLGVVHEKAAGPDMARAIDAMVEGEAMLAVATLLNYDFRAHATLPETGPLDEDRFLKIFHYGAGQDFVRALIADGGFARVDRAFREPPRSTAQIYDPRRYFTGTLPADLPAQARPTLASGEQVIATEVRGEYALRLLLCRAPALRTRAAPLAAMLRGDLAFQIGSDDRRPRRVEWLLLFEGPEAAREIASRWASSGITGRATVWEDNVLRFDLDP